MTAACWKSNLELRCHDDETESIKSAVDDYDNPETSSVGPFMRDLFEKQLYSDVDFIFKNSNECISAHRAVLAAKCEFFETLLFGDQNKNATGMKMQIEISNVPFAIFKDIVKYFYSDDIEFPDVSTALDIRTTANSFKIQSLIDRCEVYLEVLVLNEDNVCSTLQISNTKYAHDLKTRCIDYIKKCTQDVINSPDFEKCSFNTVREICILQDLNLQSEFQMLKAVLRWINVQPDHAKEDLKKSLMKCIRFLSFNPKEFREVVKQHPDLLTSGEALDTLIYLNDPTPKNMKGLPYWMNRSRRHFTRGIQQTPQSMSRKIQIPLKEAPEQKEFTELTSILQMKCINGYYRIYGVKFLLEDISNDGNMIAVLVMKTYVVPGGLNLRFSKTIDSKEAVFKFGRGIYIHAGQTFHLEAEIKACQSCKFFQFDNSKDDFGNQHFQCFVACKPKIGRFYFIGEVEYGPRVPCRPRFRKRKNKTKVEQKLETKEGTEGKQQ